MNYKSIFRFISIFQIIGGIWGLYKVVAEYLNRPNPNIYFLIIISIYSLHIIAGIFLWNNKWQGIDASIIAQLTNLLRIKFFGFTYLSTILFHVIFYINSSFDIGLWFLFGGEYSLGVLKNHDNFEIGINLIAVAFLIPLIKYRKDRMK